MGIHVARNFLGTILRGKNSWGRNSWVVIFGVINNNTK
jgi:hypothetical protein